MGSALETLCGQAFGAGQVYMLGVYMQRSWIILWVSCIILLPIYVFATPILKLLGQEDDIADLAGEFTILIIPQLFSLAINFPAQKFLQAQSKWCACLDWVCGSNNTRWTALALHICIRLGLNWCSRSVWYHRLGDRRGPGCLYYGLVQGRLDWTVLVRIQRDLGLC